MKRGYALITALLLGSCASTPTHVQNNCKISDEKYQQLVQLIKKQKGINQEPIEQRIEQVETQTQNNSEEKPQTPNFKPQTTYQSPPPINQEPQTQNQITQPNNLSDFLRQNYGEETLKQLYSSSKSNEIIGGLESISNYQEILPLLYEDLSLQIERTYYGGMKDKKPSAAERLTFLSLLPQVQNNFQFAGLLKKLSGLGVNLEFTESQAFLIPDAFFRIDDWQNQPNARKPEIHFSSENFIRLLLLRPDLQGFLSSPESLDQQLEKWARVKKHMLQSLDGGFVDGSESEFNYRNLDFLQKAQQYCIMFSLNWGNLREEITQLIDLDLSKNYTEEGGVVYVGEDGQLHLRHIESFAKEILPEQNPQPERLAGLAEDYLAPGEVFVLTGGLTRKLLPEQAARLTQEQVRSITERVAEVKNDAQNHAYSIYSSKLKFQNELIGSFHIHAIQVKEHGNAGPSGFVFQNPINPKNGCLTVGESDLEAAINLLDFNGKHALNLVFTSIDENTFDVNLYYASGKEGSHINNNTVNVSLGLYERTTPYQQR
ncbi:hypothetical protein HY837_02915 [archaeon]|nr:hypothetical protein [archaeon]